MNLYFRLLCLIFQKLFKRSAIHPLAETVLTFRCWPLDCDYNRHLTNARYASLCDLARIGAMFDHGIIGQLLAKGMGPIVTATTAIYYKDIRIGSAFAVRSKLLSWDEKFWYFRHDFLQGDSLQATVLAKGLFVAKRKVVPFATVVAMSSHAVEAPELPEIVRTWSDSVEALYRAGRVERANARPR